MIKKLTTLFFFSFLVVSLFAQLPEAIRGKQSVIAKDYNLNAANILTVPNDTSALAATNSIAIKNGVFYIKKTYWEQVNGSFQLSSGQKVYLVEDSTDAQPGSTPSDSTYYLLGAAPSGAQWSSFTAHRIALYTTSGGWEQIPGVVNDYAITLDDNIYHQYNGSTWPVASAISVLLNGNIGPMRVGTINPTRIRLMTNNVDRIKIDANGDATFLKLSGTNKGIAQFDAAGMLLRTEPAASSDTTTNKPLGIASDGTLKRMSYWPGSGSGGTSGLQANITADPALTVDNTITFTGKSLDFSGDRSTWNLNDSGRIATANDFGIYSLGYGRWLASTLYLKSSTASFGSNLKSIFHYETGTGDSVAIEAKADGLRITTLPTSTTGSIVRRNTNGFLVQGSTVNAATELSGVTPFANGGTGISSATTGDIIYFNGTTWAKLGIGGVRQKLGVVGGVPVWVDSTANGGSFYSLSGTSTGLNANTFTNPFTNAYTFNGTFTATADQDYYLKISPTATGTGTTTHQFHNMLIAPTINAGANTQSMYAQTIDGTNLLANGKTGTLRWAQRIVANSSSGVHAIQLVNSNASTGALANGAYIDIDNTANLTIVPGNGTITLSGNTIVSGIQTNATAASAALVASSSGGLTATQAELQYLGSSTSAARVYSRAGSSQSIPTGSVSSTLLIGGTAVNTFSSGTHPGIFSATFKAPTPGTIGASTVTNNGTVYIEGPPTGFSPTSQETSLWVDAGVVRLDEGLRLGYASTATSLTVGTTQNVLEVTATGQTITLPTAVGVQGRVYTIKLTASGSCTVATTSSQTIDGSTTYSLSAQYKYVQVQSNNANWIIIGNN